ncbi:hypothetical protein MAM1_0005d00579 [Mucor ambiguus]|uniref:Uncharacterized protein n=1 Tax=Mucor ambiguus TaxID=91626 RepID=A0A0C9MGR4_9FUNG|nr:hypothetical protein MAM1_0005d00579 [Mucor ambiguus]
MPPKQLSDACNSTNSSIAADDQSQSFNQNAIQTSNLSDISVGELLVKYQDNSQLLNHILAAKAEEDKRRTAEEWRQAEEARLQSKYIEFELNQRQDGSNSDNDISQSLDNFLMHHQQNDAPMFDPSYFDNPTSDQSTQFSSTGLSNSLQARLNASPFTGTSTSEYAFMPHQHRQEAVSVASSSPSIDLLSPSAFDIYQHQQPQSMSCSPPDMDDLPLFPCSNSTTALPTAPIIPSHTLPSNTSSQKNHRSTKSPSQSPVPATIPISSLSPPPPSFHSEQSKPKTGRSANIHRTLSYESVMSLDDLNMNKKPGSSSSAPPAPPPQPLDHDKVMEALRAKLRRSSSPYQNTRRKPSPEPTPPPNTYPTTGVLLLNLKSRRRKSSVTKRGSGGGSGSGSGSKS